MASLDLGDDELVAAERADLISLEPGRVRFRHPLVRLAVQASVPSADRRRIHLSLADAHATAGDVEREVWHRAAAATAPDEEVAGALVSIGDDAQARGDLATAARAYGRAATLTPDREVEAERLFAAGRAVVSIGADSEVLLEAALERTTRPELRAQVFMFQVLVATWSGRLSQASDIAARAVPEIELHDPGMAADVGALGLLHDWVRRWLRATSTGRRPTGSGPASAAADPRGLHAAAGAGALVGDRGLRRPRRGGRRRLRGGLRSRARARRWPARHHRSHLHRPVRRSRHRVVGRALAEARHAVTWHQWPGSRQPTRCCSSRRGTWPPRWPPVPSRSSSGSSWRAPGHRAPRPRSSCGPRPPSAERTSASTALAEAERLGELHDDLGAPFEAAVARGCSRSVSVDSRPRSMRSPRWPRPCCDSTSGGSVCTRRFPTSSRRWRGPAGARRRPHSRSRSPGWSWRRRRRSRSAGPSDAPAGAPRATRSIVASPGRRSTSRASAPVSSGLGRTWPTACACDSSIAGQDAQVPAARRARPVHGHRCDQLVRAGEGRAGGLG